MQMSRRVVRGMVDDGVEPMFEEDGEWEGGREKREKTSWKMGRTTRWVTCFTDGVDKFFVLSSARLRNVRKRSVD